MISLSVAPEEAKKLKALITDFLYATHGAWSVGKVELLSIIKEQNKIKVKGKYDVGGFIEYKWINFTMVLDTQYRLISYERA